ncbi:MAG: HAMP domain-containing histidine kinase [Clostridia bacterium]|nr:HAMP domain-containing histidine kinase [Clostridia bacterium]
MEEKKNERVSENIKDESEFEYRAVHSEHTYRKPPKEKKVKKQRLGITHSSAAKTMAFILCILMLCVTALSVAGVVLMFSGGIYWTKEEDLREDAFRQLADNVDYNIIWRYENKRLDELDLDEYLEYKNIGYVKVESGDSSYETYEKNIKPVDERYVYTFYWTVEYDAKTGQTYHVSLPESYDPSEYPPDRIAIVTIGIAAELDSPDYYYWVDLLITLLYTFRYWIYLIGVGAFILAILCFVFLMCSAGRRRGMPGVRASFLTKIPFEIPTAAVIFFSFLGLACIDELSYYYNDIAFAIGLIVWAIVTVIMLIFWCMSLAIRIKLGTLLKNTIVFYILHFIWRVLCFCGRGIRTIVHSLPMIWKALVLIGGVAVVELFIMIATDGEPDNLLIWWFIGKIFATLFIIYFVLMLIRLKKGAREIAEGKLDYKVDTKYLILDLKDHGEDLNRIRDGMNIAVDERLKSERMKTELITNVSHDIKTPLTSIINYSDLISREECENENIKEYAGILHNQSERMKRLLDDLVEASKASSGNIDIMLAECDARVLISQVSGEYCQRLADAGLELVCTSPEDEIRIMADGRRLWRVFDNLMNNARKYALAGTRVYVSLEAEGERAVFRFRNISREALSINADELSERFVRGDESRNTEGNGLGLSIAKSLTELQGGAFDITVDGDLFKVTVSFPIIK